MKNLFKYVFMLMVVAMGAVSFTACGGSDDEDNGGSSNSMVGTWVCDNEYYESTVYLTLKSNGSYSWKLVDQNTGETYDTASGSWTYGTNILTLKGNYNKTWIVTQFASSTMTLMDNDGDTYIYIKQ